MSCIWIAMSDMLVSEMLEMWGFSEVATDD